MQIIINKYSRLSLLLAILFVVGVGLFFTSCEKDDDDKSDGVELSSFGPMPVARGAELRFIGNNLDQVTTIIIPGDITISNTEFTEQTSKSIKLIVPQTAIEGYVEVVYADGSITTKTAMGYDEPISIESFAAVTVKAGDELTITGDYLNLVGEVLFTDKVVVAKASFISQKRKEIKLIVPEAAQTGIIAVSNGAEDPIIVYSEAELNVVLPVIETILPNPVKAGTSISISGNDLDLVTSVAFGGDIAVAEFATQNDTLISVIVPINAQDGKIYFSVASGVAIESVADLIMLVPEVSVSPATVKNGGTITIAGTNLDLINMVTFGGGADGTIEDGGTEIEIIVTVPDMAVTGEVICTTTSNKEVSGGNITLLAPEIIETTPSIGKPGSEITITGVNLDLVSQVIFTGGIEGSITSQSDIEITFSIPVGAKTGTIMLVAINGVEVTTSSEFTVETNLPDFDSYSEGKGIPGEILTINGTNLDLIKELVFPDNIVATAYGIKTSTQVEVYVPMDVAGGLGQIKMITYEGEEGFLPELFFGGTDPIISTTIMLTDFNGDGNSQSTWGDPFGFVTPEIELDGTACMKGRSDVSGWVWSWAANWGTLPVISNPNDYVFKMDILITNPVSSGVSAGMYLRGSANAITLGNIFANSTSGQWITLTFALNADNPIDGSGDYGFYLDCSETIDLSGVFIDNFRFDLK